MCKMFSYLGVPAESGQPHNKMALQTNSSMSPLGGLRHLIWKPFTLHIKVDRRRWLSVWHYVMHQHMDRWEGGCCRRCTWGRILTTQMITPRGEAAAPMCYKGTVLKLHRLYLNEEMIWMALTTLPSPFSITLNVGICNGGRARHVESTAREHLLARSAHLAEEPNYYIECVNVTAF